MGQTVADVMSTNVIVLHEEDNLSTIASDMDRLHLRHLPVVDGRKLVGMLTHRDLLRFAASSLDVTAAARAKDSTLQQNTFVGEVMTKNIQTASPDMPISKAAAKILEHKFGCLPVVEADGSLVGIITEHDIVRLFVDSQT